MRKLKTTEVALVRAQIAKQQDWKCALCQQSVAPNARKDAVLDHDHDTGVVRGVVCRNCNGMEGKINTCATRAAGKGDKLNWLRALVRYLETSGTSYIHPTHKTEAEKREARLRKAREARERKKQVKCKTS